MASTANSTVASARADEKITAISVSRRSLLGSATTALALTSVPALAAPASSEVMAAVKAIREHHAHYDEDRDSAADSAWCRQCDALDARFVCAKARDLRDLSRKMRFVLFEDYLTPNDAHNAMVHVMGQLERWA